MEKKWQHPCIMDQISVGMHIFHVVDPWLEIIFKLNTSIVGILDMCGAGFVDKLDYIPEAENAEYFTNRIQTTPLSDVVAEWIESVRLDKSSTADVTFICSIVMNVYPTMILVTSISHCAPYPGNLYGLQMEEYIFWAEVW